MGGRPGRRVPPGRIPGATGACAAHGPRGMRRACRCRFLLVEPFGVGGTRRRRCWWPPGFCPPLRPGGRVRTFSLRLIDRGCRQHRVGAGPGLPRVCPGARVGASPVCRYRPRPRQGGAAMVPGVAGGRWVGQGSAQRFPSAIPCLVPLRGNRAGWQCKQTLSRECPGIHIFQRSESRRLPRRMRGNHA
jgi:hypothetical protein